MKHKKDSVQSIDQFLLNIRLERLQIAVRFAQMDLEAMRPGDWLNVREDLLAFLRLAPAPAPEGLALGGLYVHATEEPLPQDFSEEDFRRLQADVRTFLGAVAGESIEERPEIRIYSCLTVKPLAPKDAPAPRGGCFLQVTASTHDLFLFMLHHHLQQEPPDRIRLCPECRTLFVRAYTQVYCSRRCTNKASIRQWRERQDATSTAP